jgi:hypothetical protein
MRDVFRGQAQGAKRIALGYASYQDSWLEQSPYAVEVLKEVFAEFDLALLLPSADLRSKSDAVTILRAAGLSEGAMEQKCLKQQFNTKDLSLADSTAEIDAWKIALRKSFRTVSLSDVHIRMVVPLSKAVATYAE